MPDGVGVQGFLIAECLGTPPPEFFKNGGLLGLTTPYLAMDRTTRTLFARNSAGAVVTVGGASIAWAQVTGTPTTLAGYGITDAYTKAAADARYYQPGTALAATTITGTTGTFTDNVSIASTKRLYLDGGGDTYLHESAANEMTIVAGGLNCARVDTDNTALNTRFFVGVGGGVGLQRVTLGAADSGGAGFRALRVPN